jgi:hypothetical protein
VVTHLEEASSSPTSVVGLNILRSDGWLVDGEGISPEQGLEKMGYPLKPGHLPPFRITGVYPTMAEDHVRKSMGECHPYVDARW